MSSAALFVAVSYVALQLIPMSAVSRSGLFSAMRSIWAFSLISIPMIYLRSGK